MPAKGRCTSTYVMLELVDTVNRWSKIGVSRRNRGAAPALWRLYEARSWFVASLTLWVGEKMQTSRLLEPAACDAAPELTPRLSTARRYHAKRVAPGADMIEQTINQRLPEDF